MTANPKQQEARYVRQYTRGVAEMNRQAEANEARIAELEHQLELARQGEQHVKLYYDLRVAERDAARAELAEAERRIASLQTYAGDLLRGLVAEQRGHAKLSEIVRLALTPEQYHTYREIVEQNEHQEPTR